MVGIIANGKTKNITIFIISLIKVASLIVPTEVITTVGRMAINLQTKILKMEQIYQQKL